MSGQEVEKTGIYRVYFAAAMVAQHRVDRRQGFRQIAALHPVGLADVLTGVKVVQRQAALARGPHFAKRCKCQHGTRQGSLQETAAGGVGQVV